MNRRNILKMVAVAPLLADAASAATLGDTVALPATTLIDGRTLQSDHWKGKVIIIERFATWCPFCKVQNPKLDALLRANKSKGLEVLALSIDKNAAEVPKYMKARGYTFNAAILFTTFLPGTTYSRKNV